MNNSNKKQQMNSDDELMFKEQFVMETLSWATGKNLLEEPGWTDYQPRIFSNLI